jgi:putative PIG3 family NAD(P)H quinone oxidoreductase
MKAIVITKPGGPEVLALTDVKDPEPERGEVRVRVKALALNQADILQRMGRYPAPFGTPANIPGLEFAGEIEKLGPDVEGFKLGDRVFGLVGGGSYAEYVVVHHRAINHIPDFLNFTDAAAIPEAFVTAYDAMVTQGRLSAGEFVLINAFGSGVGTAAIQIAIAIGAIPIGTTRTLAKVDKSKDYGLEHSIVAKDGKFADEVLRLSNGRGVDLVLELAGGIYLKEDLICTAHRGRIMVVGLLGGAITEIDFSKVLTKRLELRGTTLRYRPLEEKIAVARSFEKHVLPLFKSGALKPVVDKVMPWSEAAEAHAYLQEHSSFGKVVLQIE